jgi:hypothetical protein
MAKRQRKRREPPDISPEKMFKIVLAAQAQMAHSPTELKASAAEILSILADDVLLSQVHQGRLVEGADVVAFECFYAAQENPPHIYLTLMKVAGWASPDNDPQRNSEMVSGPQTEGIVKDGILHVSLLEDAKVSRFYLAAASISAQIETIPLPRGDPIRVIAGPCSAADLWSALQFYGRIARLPDTLEKRGWKFPVLAIFQRGDGSPLASPPPNRRERRLKKQ